MRVILRVLLTWVAASLPPACGLTSKVSGTVSIVVTLDALATLSSAADFLHCSLQISDLKGQGNHAMTGNTGPRSIRAMLV